jgi:CTP:phosphocholine cytidylyltransferase-like protein
MELTRNQFKILSFLAEPKNTPPSDTAGLIGTLCEKFKLPIEPVGAVFTQLQSDGLIVDTSISPKGLDALEPYRVKRAVFIAAGFGSRMVPITLNTPKPLVRVKGVRLIDTLLDAVLAAEIEEIYIVRGYLGEQFDQLLYKYPGIRFLENPVYNESNNISSALCARFFLKNAYVFESDLLLRNPDLITKYQYTSNYLGVPVKETDDWCLETKDGIVSKFGHGGKDCYHMFGISYWTARDGALLAEHLKQSFDRPDGKKYLWDYTPLEFFLKNYRVEVRECSFEDITEIDSFTELQNLDEAYRIYTGPMDTINANLKTELGLSNGYSAAASAAFPPIP